MVQVIRDILTPFSSFPEDGDSSLSEVLLPGCTVGSVRYHSEFRSAPLWQSHAIREECYSKVRLGWVGLGGLAVHWIANCVKWTHNGDACSVHHCEVLTVSHKQFWFEIQVFGLPDGLHFLHLLGHWVVLEKLIVAMLFKFRTCSEPGDSVPCYQQSATGYCSEPEQSTPQAKNMLFRDTF
jgi:hypothetical protein